MNNSLKAMSTFIVLCFLTIGAIATAQRQALNLDQAKSRVVTQLLKNEIGDRGLSANSQLLRKGTQVKGWRNEDKVMVNNDSWFFFIDDQPDANWEHNARYVLVDKMSGEMKTTSVKTPPMDLSEHVSFSPLAEKHIALIRKNKLEIKELVRIRPIKFSVQKRYAILLSGGINSSANYGRYWNDLSFIYKTLKNKYHFTDDELIVLYANGTHAPNEDLDGNGTDDVDYSATKANLTTVVNTIAAQIPADGKFFFYATNHGGTNGGQNAKLYLWGDNISDAEFATLTKKIKCGEAIYVMEQCYSGGMLDNLLAAQTYPCSTPKVCIMTAARYDEVSWGCDTEGSYDEYVYHWTAAVNGATPSGAAVDADTDNNGSVSMKEAHEYAKTQDSRTEHPQSGSCIGNACDVSLKSWIHLVR